MASDRLEGNLSLLQRLGFDRHLSRCAACTAYVRQLEVTRRLLGRLPQPEISSSLRDALLNEFATRSGERRSLLPAKPRPFAKFSPGSVLGVLVVLGLLVLFARDRSQAPGDWLIGAALVVAALILATQVSRLTTGLVAATASAAAVVATLLGGGAGEVAAHAGVHCLLSELVAAAVVGAAAWLGVGGRPPELARRCLATSLPVGALMAYAALQITCAARDSMPHLAIFHLGGVVAAAVAAAFLAGGRLVRP